MDERRPLILMVEDDRELARLNARFLGRKGYEVRLAFAADEARALMRDISPDLFILDVMLPDGDGFSLCEEFRAVCDAPILFLTGKKEPRDEIDGLGSGGDYYMRKPYDRDVLLAVVQSQLQKTERTRQRVAEATAVERGALKLLVAEGKALVDGRDAELTPKEFAVLLMLVRNEGVELTGEAIYERVWGMAMNSDTGAVRQHISRLKRKLNEENTDNFSITNRQGRGYTFSTQ
ncbi:MAG: response regulator transcription factor [Clostridiales Family XIII bacterium]|jgi:DNA-binding response OmpR family regulator|nr:response regulator transcription factor [Clostridiales Family XIII bacterium]